MRQRTGQQKCSKMALNQIYKDPFKVHIQCQFNLSYDTTSTMIDKPSFCCVVKYQNDWE